MIAAQVRAPIAKAARRLMNSPIDSDVRHGGLPSRPGKIIAVHVSYASRADQRGRRPAAPSYFLKPSSSLAPTNTEAARPAGAELLAFEGEVALVIGTEAHRVSLAEAWQHVDWVTAANDLGVYDLRAADKGSNVRSKGRDGFTPIGPDLINARDVDPGRLRVRTWVNDRLAQTGSSTDLIFPFAQFIADLSQHMTLESGDVILAGTPAGSSVIQPGDVVEVEVDELDSGHTSGRLRTPITESSHQFDQNLGSLPAADDTQRIAAWGSPAAAGIADPAPTLAADLRAKLERCPVATLSQQLRRQGLNNVSIDGLTPLPGSGKIIGLAKTLRFVPNREDLFTEHGGGHNAQKRAFDAVGENEIIVIEARGDAHAGTLGDVLALRAQANGAAGVITDGAVRDYDEVARVGLPVYSAGAHPAVLGRKHVPWDVDVTIGCGGATVQPGDVIVADSDGIIVIPPQIVEDIVDAALTKETEDGWVADRVAEGNPLEGLFPMDSRWRARYEADQEGR